MRVTPKDRVEQAWRDWRAANEPELEEPTLANLDAVQTVLSYRAFCYRGRYYRVRPIPYEIGIRLNELLLRFNRLDRAEWDAAGVGEYSRILGDAVRLLGPLMIPTDGLRRWTWRIGWRPNRLRGASEADLMALIRFFWQCRMKSSGTLRIGTDMARSN